MIVTVSKQRSFCKWTVCSVCVTLEGRRQDAKSHMQVQNNPPHRERPKEGTRRVLTSCDLPMSAGGLSDKRSAAIDVTWGARAEAKPKCLGYECGEFTDRGGFLFVFTVINSLSAKLLNMTTIHNYLKPERRLCLVWEEEEEELYCSPTNRGQPRCVGRSWKTQI